MDFKDQLKQLSERVEKLKDNIGTEEATKNALIMPFIQMLGYDVFNPLEVVPEFTCDIGTKQKEKVDYAIMKDGVPMILIECQHWGQDLSIHDNQLLRYFHVSSAKFGILTNGIIYRFYTDLKEVNKMDEKPFMEINLSDLKEHYIEELKKFHKSYFDIENILSSANGLKYTNELKRIIGEEFTNPSADFVKLFTKKVYDGMITAKVLEQFTGLMKRSIANYISDKITDKFKTALASESKEEATTETQETASVSDEDKIETTVEELESFMIIKSILRQKYDVSRILYKDTLHYFAVMFDNQRKTICRLRFNGKNKFISLPDNQSQKVERHSIETLDDIYKYADGILERADILDKR